MSFDFLDECSSEPDLYAIIGADETSSLDQIKAEFKHRAKKLHPDKVTEEENREEVHEEFERLKWAYDILSNIETRKKYDFWRRSDLAITFKAWLKLDDSSRCSLHWAAKPKKRLMLPDASQQADSGDVNVAPACTESNSQSLVKGTASHHKEVEKVPKDCGVELCEEGASIKLHRTVLKRGINGWGSSRWSSKFRKYDI